MRRTLLSGLLGLVAVAGLASLPVSCQSGGVGDPCTPEEEYGSSFSGFDVAEEYLESRSFQCATRICLVNHFQGRVSCPLGQSQDDVHVCNGPEDTTTCGARQSCVASGTLAPICGACDPTDPGCVAMP